QRSRRLAAAATSTVSSAASRSASAAASTALSVLPVSTDAMASAATGRRHGSTELVCELQPGEELVPTPDGAIIIRREQLRDGQPFRDQAAFDLGRTIQRALGPYGCLRENDTGSETGQYDLELVYPDRALAVEVTSVGGEEWRRTHDAIRRQAQNL